MKDSRPRRRAGTPRGIVVVPLIGVPVRVLKLTKEMVRGARVDEASDRHPLQTRPGSTPAVQPRAFGVRPAPSGSAPSGRPAVRPEVAPCPPSPRERRFADGVVLLMVAWRPTSSWSRMPTNSPDWLPLRSWLERRPDPALAVRCARAPSAGPGARVFDPGPGALASASPRHWSIALQRSRR